MLDRRHPSTRSWKRWTAWATIAALLFIHAKVAYGGCLLADALSSPGAHTAQIELQADNGAPCSSPVSPAEQACRRHCAQSADMPKSTLDLSAFGPSVSLLHMTAPPPCPSEPAGSISLLRPINPGPPAYLRFLRLLN